MATETQNTESDEPRVLLAAEDLIGFQIADRYRLDAVVGEGGMGIVFRSREPKLQRDIAIKLLKPGGVQGAKRLERFQREIEIIAGLSHPNIVRVFDSGIDERLGLNFIAMELVDGVSLDRVLKHKTVIPELALEIVYQMCAALTEPHALGIIHRDIKPENTLVTVMSDATIQVKILDFGIARSHDADGGRLTTTGVVMGTPRYMAPETIQGSSVDARTDLYSVGVILYEMFSGRTPFVGVTPVATMIDHVTKPAPRLDETVHNFAYPKIVELVTRLLAKEPGHRLKSARDVREAIDQIRDEYGFGRLRVTPGDTMTALLPYLRDSNETTEEFDDQNANSFESTMPMGSGDVARETDSSMIAVPAAVARSHFMEMGWSKPLPDASNEIAAVKDPLPTSSYEHPLPPKAASRPWWLAIPVVLALGAIAWFLTRPAPTPVDLKPTPPAVEEPVLTAPLEVVQEPEVVLDDAGQDAADEIVFEEPVAVEKPPIRKRPAEVKPEPKPEKEPAKVDEVKEGLDWLKH